MRTARRAEFAGLHNVEMFAVPLCGLGLLHASVPECSSGYECRCEVNVPSLPVLAYLSYYIVAKTNPCEVIWRIAVSKIIVFVLASFLACARLGIFSLWATDARNCSRGARDVLFPLPNRV